ncbi:MAG: hypothetical protein R3324_07695 [Halobacteriales archaeon]|nr:hypothetical protein [Halobacteriales archaeon]
MSISSRIQTDSLGPIHWLAVILALLSGIIHLVLGVRFFPQGTAIAFLLAGVAFLVAVGLFLVNYRRRVIYAVGVPFVLLQIVAWLWINQRNQPAVSPVEGIDKAAQVILIVVLILLWRRGS